MEDKGKKRKYTFRALSDNSLSALAMSNSVRLEEVKAKWEQIAIYNKMVCKECFIEKSLENFNRINKNRNLPYLSWSTECKNCELLRKNKERNKRAQTNGIEYNINAILKEIKKRAKQYNREIDIDISYLVELYDKQNGICPYTGCEMSFNINTFDRLSLDRIDSNKGYIKGNVRWCCWIGNNMKQNMTLEQMKEWISDIQKTISK